jgi:aerobic-type carbon monoxide dehydrogenase small subunit (CoxS/CutS family)
MIYTAIADGSITIGDDTIIKIRGTKYHSCTMPVVFYKGDQIETDEDLNEQQAQQRGWKKQGYVAPVKEKKAED